VCVCVCVCVCLPALVSRSFHTQVIAHAEFIRQNLDGDESRIMNYLDAPFQDVYVNSMQDTELAAFISELVDRVDD